MAMLIRLCQYQDELKQCYARARSEPKVLGKCPRFIDKMTVDDQQELSHLLKNQLPQLDAFTPAPAQVRADPFADSNFIQILTAMPLIAATLLHPHL